MTNRQKIAILTVALAMLALLMLACTAGSACYSQYDAIRYYKGFTMVGELYSGGQLPGNYEGADRGFISW